MSKDNGGNAFPFGDPIHGGYPGMSLRDWFAGMALQGLLSALSHPSQRPMTVQQTCEDIPETAFMLADAMIAARKS
jgi:hypothetical protein